MCFELASRPGQFQTLMDFKIRDLHDGAFYLDDLIITGATEENHLNNLERLMKKLYYQPLVAIFSLRYSCLSRLHKGCSVTQSS